MILDKTLKTLEFDKVLEKLCGFCVNTDAADFVMKIMPETDFETIQFLLNETKEADKILHLYLKDPIVSFDNINSVLQKAPKLSILSLSEILKTGRILRAGRIFKTSILEIKDITIFKDMADKIYIDQSLEKEIEKAVISEDGLSDNATPALYSIRSKIKRLNESVKEKLQSIMRSANMNKYLQDNIVTLREGRYVVPVKSEFRNNVPGLIHDQSSSGATVFVEPMAVVEANNELKILYSEEQREIEKILRQFTQKIGSICLFLENNLKILINADVCFAKAKYAKSIKAVYPNLNSHFKIDIIEGRHPLIDKNSVVPVTVKLGDGYKILIITGPNTGGKTVTLKLCGLLTVMAMCGMFIPAQENSCVCVFTKIFCDIGDEQSIEQSLSTFSSHIKNISNIVNDADDKTLVLLDELGAGTDPKEGAALALAIVDYFKGINASVMVTTHYSELKEYSFVNDKIENASMDFNPQTYAPTYKLKIGIPGSSNAIEIAKRLNLKNEIIQNAKSHLSSDKIAFENVLRLAEKSRFDAEQIQLKLQSSKTEHDKILNELKKERDELKRQKEHLLLNSKFEAKKIINAAKEEAEDIINKLKEILDGEISENSLFHARQLKRELADKEYLKQDEDLNEKLLPCDFENLQEGETVFIKSLNANGKVMQVLKHKNEALIIIGSMTARIGKDDIYLAKNIQDKQSGKTKPAKELNSAIKINDVKTEINLIGQTTIEAVPCAEAFLDNAILNGLAEVKIIHGIGTGALRNAIIDMLKHHKGVLEFRPGEYGEGERGVTIIKLK